MTPPEGPGEATVGVPPLDGPPTQPAGRAGLGGPVRPDVAERASARLAGVRRRASELRWRRALGGVGTAVVGLAVAVVAVVVTDHPGPVDLRVTALPGTTTTTAPITADISASTTTTPAAGGVPVSVVPTLAPPTTAAQPSSADVVPVATVSAPPTSAPSPVEVESVSASSPSAWWVLGSAASCSTSNLCLLHTTDGGTSYRATALPSQVTGGGRLSVSGNVLWLWNAGQAWSLTAGAAGNYSWADVGAAAGHRFADVQGAGDGSAYALETCDGTTIGCAIEVLQLKPGAAGSPIDPAHVAPPVAVAAAGGEAWIAYQDGSVDSWSGGSTLTPQGSPCPKGKDVTDMAASASPSGTADVVVALCEAPPSAAGAGTEATPYVLPAGGSWSPQQSFSVSAGQTGPATPLAVDPGGDVCAAAAGGLSCQSAQAGLVLFSVAAPQQVTDVSVVSSTGATAGLAVVASPSGSTGSGGGAGGNGSGGGELLGSSDGLHYHPVSVSTPS